MRPIALTMMLLPSVALADWQKLDDEQISALLTDARVIYDGSWQEFLASGQTRYHAGSDRWGLWRTRGGRFCSRWPPAENWICYTVERDGDRIRFVGAWNDVTVGRIE